MAGIYNGHLLEFPQIRVDCFTSPRPSNPHLLPSSSSSSCSSSSPSSSTFIPAPPAQLYLLTHVHSDHLLGLSSTFTGKIICSPDTKRMLLRLEAEQSRQFLVDGTKEVVRRKYEGLGARTEGRGTRDERVVDMIEALPYGYPKEYDLGYDSLGEPVKVTITLLDANHCPGSTMFLVTSPTKAILHTGDIRCDKLFMQSLRRNPAIQEFIIPTSTLPTSVIKQEAQGITDGVKQNTTDRDTKGKGRLGSGRRVLDRIYLDTSAVLGTGDMPDKEDALQDLLQHMSLYPPDTVFFLNVWCFGWEDVVKEVARYFDTQVHVDRYKSSIYSAVRSDPFLTACTTTDPSSTRFHACERRAKCEGCRTFDKSGKRVWYMDKRVVHVNMVEVKSAAWAIEREAFLDTLARAAIGEGDWPYNILCPIARHSPLPELQRLVNLFRPHNVSPNTVVPQAQGLDYFLLPDFLKDHLQPGGYDRMIRERDTYFSNRFGPEYIARLKSLQSTGIDLTSILDTAGVGSERDEYLPDPTTLPLPAAPGSTLGRSRKAHAADQLSRAGGISITSMSQLRAVLGDQAEKLGNVFQGAPAGYEARVMAFPVPTATGSRGQVGFFYDGYDTDEESGKKRRRKRYSPERIDTESEASNPSLPLQPTRTSSVSEAKPLQTYRPTNVQISGDVLSSELQSSTPSTTFMAAETKGHTSAGSYRPTPRFFVDKDHLRALALIGDDEN